MSNGGARRRPVPGARPSSGGDSQGDLFGAAGGTAPSKETSRIRVGELGGPPEPLPPEPLLSKPTPALPPTPTDASPPEPPHTALDSAAGRLARAIPPLPAPEPTPAPPAAPQRAVLTVAELTRRIKNTLESDFPRVWVRGEVSGFRGPHVKGHLYFSLKDDTACIDVKIWASSAQRMKFKLRDGMELLLEGSVDVYERQGRYSLIAHRAEPVGEGALALAFQQLKERLTAEGLMGDARKRPPRPLPFWPRRIGVVTSRTGAALKDFLRVLDQRNPRMSVLLCDARVQGEGAADDVCRALAKLAAQGVDVIVVTRGGGSVEDLWTFNEEKVARAIHASPVPVVSAIGHEVDFTIADFVADHRAPTPTAAAAMLAPVLADLELGLQTLSVRLRKAAERQVLTSRQRLTRLQGRLVDPRRVLGQKRLHLNALLDKAVRALRQKLRLQGERHRALAERLGRMRPEARLGRDRHELAKLRARLDAAMRARVQRERRALGEGRHQLVRVAPSRVAAAERRKLADQRARLEQALSKRRHEATQRFREAVARLHAMSPLAVLSRGYAVAFRASDGRVLREARDVSVGESIRVTVAGAGCRHLDECDEIVASVTHVRPAPERAGGSGGGDGPV